MYIITVAPIVRGIMRDSLTYFSKDPILNGAVIMVPIRSREVPALVLESKEASDIKSELRGSDFAIRKITKATPRNIWLPQFLRAVERTAEYSVQHFGEAVLSLTPRTILDAHLANILKEPRLNKTEGHFNIFSMAGNTKARYEEYRQFIRDSFARKESVFICVPTENDASRISNLLGHGIEHYTFELHSGIKKNLVLEKWNNISNTKHPILVVGTAQYLSLPHYFKTIILEEEHSHAWKMLSRPFLDLRIFVEEYAKASESTLIIGAPLLRAETYQRLLSGEIKKFGAIGRSERTKLNALIVDPRKEEKFVRENIGRKDLVMITAELRKLLENASLHGENTLLLSARKGLSPVTTCSDCGSLVRCPECDSPLVTHKKEIFNKTENIFICHGCGFMRLPENNINEKCIKCGGWRLQGVGIGIDRIDDEIKKLFPNSPRFVLDSEKAKTRTEVRKIIEQFKKSRGGILIATPMALPFLDEIENTAIVSIDSLFAIPDIRMLERVFVILLSLCEKTKSMLLVQTRTDDTTPIEQALRGDISTFSENELANRKAFSYPPYSTIIKITLREKRDKVAPEMERLRSFLADYSPIVPGTMAREAKNIFRMNMIMKLPQGSWPDISLLTKLRSLPPQFLIEVNPDNLL